MVTAISQEKAYWDATQPLTSACAGIRLTPSQAASDTTSGNVAAGDYEVCLSMSSNAPGQCWISWAGSISIPADKAQASAGTFVVRDGSVVRAPGSTALTAQLTGTGNTAELTLNPLT